VEGIFFEYEEEEIAAKERKERKKLEDRRWKMGDRSCGLLTQTL